MTWTPVSIGGGCYADDTKPWSSQDTVNRIPVRAEVGGGRSPTMFRSAPGLQSFANIGTGPIRGMHDAEGKLLVVSGTQLYKISPTGGASLIGTVAGSGRVIMAHNQITGGNEVVIVTGGTVGYVYNTSTGVLDTITNVSYPGAICADYINGYLVQVEPQRRYFFHSELYDAHKYLSTSTYESEASPDLIQGLIVDHLELIVLNERTIELFQNTGAQTSIFESKRIVIEKGCAGPYAYAKIDNSVVFLGNDGTVYRLNGYQPQRISTTPIEQAISRNDMTNAVAFTYSDRGHQIFYLTLPDGQTWGYDVATTLWHRRESFGLKRWRLDHLLYWNGKWIGGDFQNGTLYKLDWDYPQEGTQPLIRQRTFGVEHASGNRITIDAVQLEYDTGSPQASSTFNAASPPAAVPSLSGSLAIVGTPPSGEVGQAYSFGWTAIGGTGTGYTFTVLSGTVVAGTSFATPTLSGTPTTKATYTFVLQVTDSGGNMATATQVIAIASQLYGYVANTGSSSVSVINRAGTVVATIGSVNTSDPSICVTPDRRYAYVAATSGAVKVIDSSTLAVVATVTAGTGSNAGCAMKHDGTKVYVANTSDSKVYRIDVATNLLDATYTYTGISSPTRITMHPTLDKMYVTDTNAGVVVCLNTAGSTLGTITVSNPQGLGISPDGNTLYVGVYGGLYSYSTISYTLANAVAYRAGFGPNNVAVTLDGTKAYVSDYNYNTVAVVNTATFAAPTYVNMGTVSYGIATNPGTGNIYVTTAGVQIINPATDTVASTITVGTAPHWISFP